MAFKRVLTVKEGGLEETSESEEGLGVDASSRTDEVAELDEGEREWAAESERKQRSSGRHKSR